MSDPSPEPLVLMYHGLDPGDGRAADADPAVLAYVISAATFRAHLETIRNAGRHILPPDGFLSAPTEPITVPSPCPAVPSGILLTFDDGSASDYDAALPALRAAGAQALFFVTTAQVGRPGRVGWAQLREMAAAGMGLGSHGHTHEFLTFPSETKLREELRRSRQLLEDQAGVSVRALSLPGGRFNRWTLAAAAATGFHTVFTSSPQRPVLQRKEALWLIGRVPVRATWPPQFLPNLLAHPDQHLRRMKRTEALRRAAQTVLGDRGYSWLHRAVWRVKGH